MATDQLIARDAVIRQAAFDHIRALQSRDLVLSHEDIARGFIFQGQRWPLWNPQRGIFKPREMPFLLSIRTVFPRKGGRVWYDDQRHVHQQIFAGEEELDYAFMGNDPGAPDNVWLREAAKRQVPLIYSLGVSPGRYQAIIPTFVVSWDPRRLTARIAFGELVGAIATATAPDPVERLYALRLVKQRLHQASFRDSVLAAYDHRCAISNLPDDHLLDAAHIMADAHDLLGQPVVANGIALSKIHQAAFDNHLIGIDPDGRVHVSERLLMLHDGPLLEQSLKAIAGTSIRPPGSELPGSSRAAAASVLRSTAFELTYAHLLIICVRNDRIQPDCPLKSVSCDLVYAASRNQPDKSGGKRHMHGRSGMAPVR